MHLDRHQRQSFGSVLYAIARATGTWISRHASRHWVCQYLLQPRTALSNMSDNWEDQSCRTRPAVIQWSLGVSKMDLPCSLHQSDLSTSACPAAKFLGTGLKLRICHSVTEMLWSDAKDIRRAQRLISSQPASARFWSDRQDCQRVDRYQASYQHPESAEHIEKF
jgi:hypothetical protein